MQIKTFPHEFLARWGRDGRLQGYHVIPVDILCDDAGVPLTKEDGSNQIETFGQATTLERAGLALTDLLGDALPVVIMAKDRLDAELIECKSQLAEATRLRQETADGLARAEQIIEAQNAEIAGLRSQLAEAQARIAGAALEGQTP